MQTKRPADTVQQAPLRPDTARRAPWRAPLPWSGWVLVWGTVLLAGLAVLIWQVFQTSQGVSDLCQDYGAAQRLLRGAPVYSPLTEWPPGSTCPLYNAHPPASVFGFLPFGLLPYMQASLLWGLISLAAYLASGALLLRALGWPLLRGLALFVAGSLCWAPLTGAEHAQNLGQVLLLLVVAAWCAERRGRAGLAGVLIGIAGLLKLWPLLLLAGALVWCKTRLLLTGAAAVVAGVALSLAFMGISAYSAYFGPVQVNEHASVPDVGNVSLVGALIRFVLVPSQIPFLTRPKIAEQPLAHGIFLAELAGGVLVVVSLALIWWGRRRAPAEATDLLSQSLLVTLTMLIFPITWQWGLITLLFPGALILLALRQLPGAPRGWLVLLWVGLLPLLAPSRALVDALSKFCSSIHLTQLGNLLTQVLINWLLVLAPFGLVLFMLAQMGLLWHAARAGQAAPD